MSDSIVLDDEELQKIYTWVDEIPLSRPKRNITRDFSDGGEHGIALPPSRQRQKYYPALPPPLISPVLFAETVRHYFPKLIDMHNYSPANSVRQKMYNWATLNQKVFRRLNFMLEKSEIDAIVACKPGAVEVLLMRLQRHIAEIRSGKRQLSASVEQSAPTSFANYAGGSGLASGGATGSASSPYHGTMTGGHASAAGAGLGSDTEALLAEKNATISELQETIEILELKVKKLEQVRVSRTPHHPPNKNLTCSPLPPPPPPPSDPYYPSLCVSRTAAFRRSPLRSRQQLRHLSMLCRAKVGVRWRRERNNNNLYYSIPRLGPHGHEPRVLRA